MWLNAQTNFTIPSSNNAAAEEHTAENFAMELATDWAAWYDPEAFAEVEQMLSKFRDSNRVRKATHMVTTS
jgi:hypothetical protein